MKNSAFKMGKTAAKAGKSYLSNPFKVGTDNYIDWCEGWDAATEKLNTKHSNDNFRKLRRE